jgi:predicted RNA-binding protein
MTTWILTGSLENFRINVERGFDVIGLKERRRNQALELEPGNRIAFYVTGLQAFGALARVRSPMFEDRSRIWPRSETRRPDDYPWRVAAEPVVVLDESEFVPAESLADRLEHVRKWPRAHWRLAFQGQFRAISQADAKVLAERIAAAAGVAAAR